MSDAIHDPIPRHKAPMARARRRRELPSSGLEPVLGTADAGIKAGIRSPSGTDRANFVDLEQLPRDVGWLLFGVGFAGFVAPGVFGLPFMVGGGMILWPKTTKQLFSLLGGGSPQTMNAGIKQVLRFLDDLEKRYPSART